MMSGYLLKRVLFAVPTILVVSVLVFFLAQSAPGDHVETLLTVERDMGGANMSYSDWYRQYERIATRTGKTDPVFYISLVPGYWPDTLHKILPDREYRTARALLRNSRNWPMVEQYLSRLRSAVLISELEQVENPTAVQVGNDARYLMSTYDRSRTEYLWQSVRRSLPTGNRDLDRNLMRADSIWSHVLTVEGAVSIVMPRVVWHGGKNQYHSWISNMLVGDFGVSVVDGRPVGGKIKEAVGWTLRLNLTAIILAFGIAVPLGLAMARRKESYFDRISSKVLFIFFAVPSFWLGTLLIVFFTTPEYAKWLDLFPAGGIGNYHFATGLKRFGIIVASLFLPVLSLLLGALAYLTRQMRDSVVRESREDYVRMARAKGLKERTVYRRHILRNALFPMITMLGAAIPASVSGSVVIEILFGIPGMGRLLFDSILSQDWLVVFVMVLLAAILTIAGYALSDILYRLADPRLRKERVLIR